MNRREELLKIVNESNSIAILPLIDRMIFLETKLEELEKLPMIRINAENPSQQKATPAAKQYREFLQQYTNVVKIVVRISDDNGDQQESPLRAWARERGMDCAC